MTKTESALIRKEIRALRSALNTRQKQTARAVRKHREVIRQTEKEIALIEREAAAYTTATTNRLAILDGRLRS
jgi:predicted translin family RNA/ssDNA-binding protein